MLLLLFFRLFAATASRVPWPSRRSSAAPTTEPTHHYADWIITIAYIRHPYGLPAKDSVPARVSFSHTHTHTLAHTQSTWVDKATGSIMSLVLAYGQIQNH